MRSAGAMRRAAASLFEAAAETEIEQADVRAALELLQGLEPQPPAFETPGQLLKRACAAAGVNIEDVRNTKYRKNQRITKQRILVSRVLRLAGLSLTEIGDAMHTDHSSQHYRSKLMTPQIEHQARLIAARLGVGGALARAWRPPHFVVVPARLARARWDWARIGKRGQVQAGAATRRLGRLAAARR